MSGLIDTIQAIVREELQHIYLAELGVVTELHAHESENDRNNYECSVRLRDSGLELRFVPIATPRLGLCALPNVGDLVLVQFLGGDANAPVVTARLYSERARPPIAKAGEWVYESPDSKESGIRRAFLKLPNGATLTWDDDAIRLETGATKLMINHDGEVVLESADKVTIKSAGDTVVEAQGALSIKAAGDLSLEGMNVTLKAQVNAQVEGQVGATLKGINVAIKGVTAFSAG
ncbi:MAG: phage baseplate assembly protein V [Anaerolineae bacterium]|nr:phage baseplate assembly protein V [Anaerolineae bacterium]MDW8099648.1 phage baseplate assembly protein V [Anaerolineae bacterium]